MYLNGRQKSAAGVIDGSSQKAVFWVAEKGGTRRPICGREAGVRGRAGRLHLRRPWAAARRPAGLQWSAKKGQKAVRSGADGCAASQATTSPLAVS